MPIKMNPMKYRLAVNSLANGKKTYAPEIQYSGNEHYQSFSLLFDDLDEALRWIKEQKGKEVVNITYIEC